MLDDPLIVVAQLAHTFENLDVASCGTDSAAGFRTGSGAMFSEYFESKPARLISNTLKDGLRD
jgi:hypothetical protein